MLSNARKGFTTGSCAQAAAKAAGIMLWTKRPLKKVKIQTPSGVWLNLKLIDQKIGKDFASCAVVKDSGDDPDITDRAKIYARVRLSRLSGITIKGGKGVGRVTKPGLSVKIGEYAINPIPRQMILKELSSYLPKARGLEVVISVPEGKRLAKKTFNPRLGIIGGISIIGTTGIVEPKSLDSYKQSLSLQLDVLKASGISRVYLVLGYVGERFCKDTLKIGSQKIIKIGDQAGYMLKECLKKEIKDVILLGHISKMVKIANGQFNTHYSLGDNRLETIIRYAQRANASKQAIKEIGRQSTAEAAVEIIRENGLSKIFNQIARDVVLKLKKLTAHKLRLGCVILSLDARMLAAYPRLRRAGLPAVGQRRNATK